MSAPNPAAPMATNQNSGRDRDEKAGWPVQTPEEIGFETGPSFDAAALDFDFAAAAEVYGPLPDFSKMEDGLTDYHYSHGNEMINSNNNNNPFDGDFDEARMAKTPGYNFDEDPADFQPTDMSYQASAHANDGYHAQTPFQSSSDAYDAKTPYVAPTPYSSPRYQSPTDDYGRVPELNLDDGDNTNAAEDFVPPESPLVVNFASSTTSLPATKPGSAKKTPRKTPKKTPASRVNTKTKSRAKAPLIEDDSGEEVDDGEEGRKIFSSARSKGKGRAQAVVTQADDGGDNDKEEGLKTRSSTRSKAKGRARPFVAADAGEEDEDEDGDSYMTSTPAAASTTKAKGRKGSTASKASVGTPSKKPKTSTPKKSALKKKTTDSTLTTMGHQRQRAAAKNGIVAVKPIPTSFEECDEGDKVLITTREAGGTWAECKVRYFEVTGITHGNSTLPNRYERLKTAFINMRDEDNLHLFEAKRNIEEDFNNKKWAMISEAVEDKTGIQYDPMDLKRRFRQLMEKTGFPVDEGLARKDVDFMGEGDDEEDVEDTPEPARRMPNIQWDVYGDEDEDAVGGAEQEYHNDHEDTEDLDGSRFEQQGEQEQMDVDDDDEEADRGLAW